MLSSFESIKRAFIRDGPLLCIVQSASVQQKIFQVKGQQLKVKVQLELVTSSCLPTGLRLDSRAPAARAIIFQELLAGRSPLKDPQLENEQLIVFREVFLTLEVSLFF